MRKLISGLAVLCLLSLLCPAAADSTFLIRMDGTSMSDTLADGETMEVIPLNDGGGFFASLFGGKEQKTVSRFDVVICRYPDRGSIQFVDRVVGMPGDIVEIQDGYLYVNGEKYDEPYINDSYRAGESWGSPVQVPKKGDQVALNGTDFLVNGHTYSYGYTLVSLEGDVSVCGLHTEPNFLAPFNGIAYLVKTGSEEYILASGKWFHVAETLINTPGGSDTFGELPPDSIVARYYNNQQRMVQAVLQEIGEAPIREGSFTVAEDSYFVMGDHRNNSRDSRWCGAIPDSLMVGVVWRVVWPPENAREIPNGEERVFWDD